MTTLRERIAALEKRNAASSPSVPATTPSPSSTPANTSTGRLKSVKDVASRFDEIGGAPVPRGSFGLGVPQSSGPKSTTSRELYGNRIPKPRNVSASDSPSRSPDGLRTAGSTPFGGGSQAGSEMGDEDWEERVSERSASPIGDHPDHQQHASRSRSNSPSPNTPDVHNEDEPTRYSPTIETPIIAVSTGEGLTLSLGDPAAIPAAAVHQPLPPSPLVEPTTPEVDEPAVAEPTAAEIPAPPEPSPNPQEPIAQPDIKPTEDVETETAVETTPRAATFAAAGSATDSEPPAVEANPAYVEPHVESANVEPPQPAVVEVPAPVVETPIEPAPAPVEEQPIPSPAPEPTPVSPIVDAEEQAEPIAASPVRESEAPPQDPSPAAEEPIASQPVYEAARYGSLAAVPEDEPAPAPAPAPVGRKRGLSVHVPEVKSTNTTIVDEANETEIRPLPPLPPMPAVRAPRSPASHGYRSTSMYIPTSPVSPTMTEFAMGQGGVNPPLRNSSLRRNVESTQARIERRIAVSTSGSGGGGTGFGRSGSSGWRSLTSAPEAPLPVVSVLPSKMRDRRDSQDKSRPKSMADIFQTGDWASVPDLSLEIPKTPTRLPANKLLPNPISHDSQTRPLSSSTLASFMESQPGTVNSTIFDEFPTVPNHIPPSQIFTETEETAPTPTPDSLPSLPPSTLSPPHHEDDRISSASVKSKGSKFRGLSKLMGSAAHSITHGVQRTVSQRRRTSDASQPGSSPSRQFGELKKHSTVDEPESPLRSTWMDEEKKKKTGWASIGVGRRK